MPKSHVLSGLIAKHSELSGEIDYHQNQIKQIRADISTVSAAIKVFNPEYDLRTIKPKGVRTKSQIFKHGESSTLLMDVIREADRDISTTDIVAEVAKRKGVDLEEIDRRAFTASLFTVLKRLQSKKIIEEVDRIDGVIEWRML